MPDHSSPQQLKATDGERAAKQSDILLVVPPFQSCARPSLGVSQLKANLAEAGFSAKVLYLNLLYAERIGWWIYEWISNVNYDYLLGEFIFSGAYYERSEQDVQRYVEDVLKSPAPDEFLPKFMEGQSLADKLQYLIREASDFCRTQAVQEILAHDPWLVGSTSSFHQNCASVSMLRGVKQQRPEITTAMGGANCEAEMGEELLAQFPEVDFIGQGNVTTPSSNSFGPYEKAATARTSRGSSSRAMPVRRRPEGS